MRRVLFAIASLIAILTFSCDSSQSPFDDSLPDAFTLTTQVSPEGSGEVDPSGGEFLEGSRIEIEAMPRDGFIFERWEGDLTGSVNPDSLIFNRNLSITAHFIPLEYELNIEVVGEGTVRQEIISQQVREEEGEDETIAPAEVDTGDRETTFDIDDSIDGRDLDQIIQPDQQETQNRISLQQQVQESGASLQSVTIQLTAEPADGWFFARWEGDLTGDENPVEIVLDEDKNITAVFEQEDTDEFVLDVQTEGEGAVEIDPDRDTYLDGDEVTMTAIPDSDWNFIEWQGDLTGSENPATVVMDSDKSITAFFAMEGAPELEITEQPTQTVAGNPISPAPAVQLSDPSGSPVEGEEITVSLNTGTFTDGSTTEITTDQDGFAIFDELIIEAADQEYEISFSADMEGVSTVHSDPFAVIPAAGDPSSTTAQVPNGVAGETTLILIHVADIFGNEVEGAADQLSVTISGANNAESEVDETDTGGEYRAEYIPTNTGEDQIDIELNGEPIDGSPFSSEIITSDVSSSNSSVTADPSELSAGESSTLTIVVRDDQNNVIAGMGDEIELQGLSNATAGEITESEEGTYTTQITNTQAEELTVTILVEGVTLDDQPVIVFTAAEAENIEIVSGNNQTGTVSEELPEPFVIRVTDEFGNPVENHTIEFEITDTPPVALGQSLSEESVTTDESGEASTVLTLGTSPGTYQVEADAENAGSVTFTAQAEIGVASALVLLEQPLTTVAGEIILPEPVIEVTDDADNPVEGVEVTVSIEGGTQFDSGTTTQSTNPSGEAIFDNLVIQTAGSYSLRFTADASETEDLVSDEFNVTAADPDPENSSAEVPDGAAGEQTLITITVQDEFDNPVSDIAGLISINVSGDNNATPTAEDTDNPGEYAASYTPTNAGSDQISIELDGTPIAGSPFTSNVTTSDISSSNSTVTAEPQQLQVGESSTVTVELKDDSDNPIAGLTDTDFSISFDGNADAGSVSETSVDGTYEFIVTSNDAGTVTVTVNADGVTLDDSPQITFEAGEVDVVVIRTQPQHTEAGQPIGGPPEIRLLDNQGNRVTDVEVTVSEQSGQSFASGTETVISDELGEAVFDDLVITETGRYNLVFSGGGETVTSNAFDITASDPVAEETTADVPNGSAGDATQVTITVRDQFGNPVEGVAGALSVSVSGANSGADTDPVNDEGNGLYSTSYTPTNTGEDEISITLDGSEISGSPYTSTVITSDADDISIDRHPGQTIAGQPIEGPPSVSVVDDLGNPVEDIEVIVTEQGGASFASGTTSQFTGSDGIAEFNDLIINQAGNYTLEFNAIGVSENAISNPFDVVAASAAVIEIESGDGQSAAVTEQLPDPLTVLVEDEFGNIVEGETVNFEFTGIPDGASGQQLSDTSVETDGSGLASVMLTLGDTPGEYTVQASSSAGSVSFSAEAEAGELTSFSISQISSPQTAGEPFAISITGLDSEGNIASGYDGAAVLTTTAGSITPDEANFSGGTVSLDVQVSETGMNQTITVEDGGISETSNPFDVESGGVDPENSAVSADPLEVSAGTNSTLTIELRDASNNPVGGHGDSDFSIEVTGDGTTTGLVTETVTTGTYEVEITNNTAETVTVSVSVNGVTLNDSPEIQFVPAEVDDIEIVSGNNQTGVVSGTLENPLVVRLVDEFGNPVSEETVSFEITEVPAGASGHSLSETSASTGNDGQASTELTLGSAPGTYMVTASATGAGAVTFSAEAELGEASQMAIEVQPSENTAGELMSPAPAVLITDDQENPIEDIGVTVSVTGNVFTGTSTTQTVTNVEGIAEFDNLVINEAGSDYIMTFDADAAGVDNVSSVSFDITAAAGDPSQTTADVPDGTAGNPTVITMTVQDEFGNTVEGVSGNLALNVSSGPNQGATFTPVQDAGNGEYTSSYEPESIGFDEIAIELDDVPINGSPFTSEVTTSDVSASNSSATADPDELTVGNSSTVTIELRDGSNNPISGLSNSDFTIDVTGQGVAGSVSETTTDGTYEFEVNNETAEQVTVTITASGVPLDDTPEINFIAGDPNLMVIIDEPETTVAGEFIQGPPAVEITDEFDNPVPDVSVTVTEQGGQSFEEGTLTQLTNSSGIASFDDLIITEVGNYNLVFEVSGITNRTSNAFEVIAAEASSIIFDTISSPQTAGVEFEISLTAEDDFGNTADGYNGTANLATTAGDIDPSEALFSGGTVSLNVTVSQAGDDQTISAEDGAASGISNNFDVDPGPVSGTESSVTADPSEVTANGEATSELTLQVRDENGNPISGLLFGDFTFSGQSQAEIDESTFSESGSSGDYTVDVSNETVENVTIQVVVDEENIGSVGIDFVA